MNDKRENNGGSSPGVAILVAGAMFVAVLAVSAQSGKAVRAAEDAKFLSSPPVERTVPASKPGDEARVVVTPAPDRFDRQRPSERSKWSEPVRMTERKKDRHGRFSRKQSKE